MRSAILETDHFLHGDGLFAPDGVAARPAWWLPLMICAFGPVYGAVMGSFSLETPDRLWLVLFSAVKVPLLLFATSVLCLPGFFVLNTLAGLRDDFGEALQAILAGQAGLSVETRKVLVGIRAKLDDNKVKLADTVIKLRGQQQMQREANAREALRPPTEPRGRAKPGRAFTQ